MASGQRFDAIVIGAGIVGLAHAYLLGRQGRQVLVLERDDTAVGASIQNFGMIGAGAQPQGPRRELALRSRALWLELLQESGIWYRESGALRLAYAEDEMAVLTEYLVQADDPTRGQLLTPAEVTRLSPGVRREGLLGALYSRGEFTVDPRTTVRDFAAFLGIRYGVEFRFGANVEEIATGEVRFSGGVAHADRIFVCAGAALPQFFPEATTGTRLSRLRMLRFEPPAQPVGPQLSAGWTLTRFESFRDCPSMPTLKRRLAGQFPEQAMLGIHALVAEHGDGSITVGDSHTFGEPPSPEATADIERLILETLDQFLPVAGLTIRERWEGSYLSHPELPYLVVSPLPGVKAVACFGAGMTMSMAVAEQAIAAT